MEFESKYVIIGGGIAGTVAAETLRKLDPDARIIIISDEPCMLYSRVLLTKPNFFLEKIPFERIFLKQSKWYEDLRIEIWCGRKVVKIDPKDKFIHLDNGENLRYEKLLIAVGGTPRKLNIPGATKKGVHYLRTIFETKEIIQAVKHAKHGVAIGGGIIGYEMAEMMELAGMKVTFVILKPHYRIGVLGEETAKKVENAIRKCGVDVKSETETVEILGDKSVEGIRFADGKELKCDLVVIGIGTVIPHADMLRDAGLVVSQGIIANQYLETNVPDIWTAGDCTEYYDVIIDDNIKLGNWANAQAQGQHAAHNMFGKRNEYRYVSFFTTHGFGLAMTYVGDVRQNIRGRCVIERGSPKDHTFGRIIVERNRVVGALFVNSSKQVSAIIKLIESGTDISEKQAELANPDKNLADLI